MDTPQLTFVAQHRVVIASLVVLYALCELGWYLLARRRLPDLREVAANLGIGVVSALLRSATFGARLLLFALVYELSPFRIATTWTTTLAC
jgi:hypothetical protein